MKYIRTKDHIYKRLFIDKAIINELGVGACDKDLNPIGEQIIKESNNLDELCDFAYALWKDNAFEVYDLNYDCVKVENWSKWLAEGEVLELYYGIKTDKGLIYVAKMNNKGKLESL